jgi:5-oxopent-3-ene-1,2,5-tricarboxylate decarboxylase/2-hydroxyhepta-2,4-diene-1,7-dioate isomerase
MRSALISYEGRTVPARYEDDTVVLADGTRLPEPEARFLPPVEGVSKIIATHLTYRSRAEEYRMARLPEFPNYFLMPPSSLSAHRAPVVRPRGTEYLNYEGELVVVIGTRCKDVAIEEALQYVAGYTIANDWGIHDFRHADRGAMFRVKGQDGFCPIGPAVVDSGDVDPDDLTIRTFVNGTQVQEGHTGRDLMFSAAYQVADIARHITLEPGDLILTGTPANSRPVQPGDVVAVEIDGIGRLDNTVVEAEQDPKADVGYQPDVTAATLHVALAVPEDEAEARIAGRDVAG